MVAGLERLFLAVPLPEEARQAIFRLLVEAAPGGLPGRLVHPAAWHVTLRFLGEAGPVERDRLLAAVDGAPLGPAFRIRWGGLGAFPRPGRAAVLWVGMAVGEEESILLAGAVEEAAVSAGFPAEDRPFRSHLTLSRIRPPRDVATLIGSTPALGIDMAADRVVLYRSHLGRGGARYEIVEEFRL